MKLVLDESVDAPIAARLRADGHAVEYIAETCPSILDDAVLARANATESLLVTSDKDFGELVFRLGRAAFGVILIRLAGLSVAAKCEIVSAALRVHYAEIPQAFTVVSPNIVRIRRHK